MGRNTANFDDVSRTHWATRYIASAAKANVVKGYNKDTYDPSGKTTREQAATIIQRAGKLNTLSDSEVNSILAKLSDGGKISDYARKPVAEIIDANMSSDDRKFNPKNSANRGDVAKMIMGLMIKLGHL